MLYQLAHHILQHLPLIWNGIEQINDWLFAIRYRHALTVLNQTEFGDIHLVTDKDVQALVDFFATQSPASFTFFHPHQFDTQTIQQLIHRRSMVMLATCSNQRIVGYAFLRCFWLGRAYRGYMVDEQHRGQGIGKKLGKALNTTQQILDIKTYKSISPDNLASLALAKATCQLLAQDTTDNGDICYQCIVTHD